MKCGTVVSKSGEYKLEVAEISEENGGTNVLSHCTFTVDIPKEE